MHSVDADGDERWELYAPDGGWATCGRILIWRRGERRDPCVNMTLNRGGKLELSFHLSDGDFLAEYCVSRLDYDSQAEFDRAHTWVDHPVHAHLHFDGGVLFRVRRCDLVEVQGPMRP